MAKTTIRGVRYTSLIGRKFGRLRIAGYIPGSQSPRVQPRFICICSCGQTTKSPCGNVVSGATSSCGCYSAEISASRMRRLNTTHGVTNTPTFRSWCAMRDRCCRPCHQAYGNYGGRGIVVCDRWLQSFENFLADMGERPTGTSLDRIDTNGNYEPGNCRWATPREQARNSRQNRLYTIQGKTACLIEWAEYFKIPYAVVQHRLDDGWDPEAALTKPVKHYRPRKKNVPNSQNMT